MIDLLLAMAVTLSNPYPAEYVCLAPVDDAVVAQGDDLTAVRAQCSQEAQASAPAEFRLIRQENIEATVPTAPVPSGPIPVDVLAVLNGEIGRVDITVDVGQDLSESRVPRYILRFDTRLTVFTWRDAVHVRFRDLNTGLYQVMRTPWGVLPPGEHVITVTWGPEAGYALLVDGRLHVHVFELSPLATAFSPGGSDAIGGGDPVSEPFTLTATPSLAPFDPCSVNPLGKLNGNIDGLPDPRGKAPGCPIVAAVPTEPVGVSADGPESCMDDEYYLYWQALEPDPPLAEEYRLFIGTLPGVSDWLWRFLAPPSSAGMCVSGLAPQTTYTVRMRSRQGTTFSPFSNPLTFTTD